MVSVPMVQLKGNLIHTQVDSMQFTTDAYMQVTYGRGIKNLIFRNCNTHRITHLFYVRFMITLRML